ncbi:MAG: TPR repeat protein [Saprospiraceae bacterium]|jgi:TPR repeat protein|tara:strand:+ start:324 stop:866 length:543 start_codon:yes stop_codon:yes gene_type:complete
MKIMLHYFSLILFCLWIPVSYGDSIKEAYDIIRNGDPKAGYEILRLSGEADADARAYYGIAHLRKEGWGVDQDAVIAIEYYKKAAELGHLRAMFDLGTFYQNGHMVQQNYPEAIKWYKSAANKGYAAAMYGLGGLYFNGLGVKKDPDMGTIWFTKAAKTGFTPAIQFLDQVNNLGMSLED